MTNDSLPSAEPVITYTAGDLDTPPDLRILHFNDGELQTVRGMIKFSMTDEMSVYHIDASSAEPVGGIARFKTLCDEYRNDVRYHGQPELLTFFSGDAFNPSLESSITKGSFSQRQPHS